MEETNSFYQNVLGFTSRSNFPNFVSLSNGEVQIMFVVPTEEPENRKDPNDREPFFLKPKMTFKIAKSNPVKSLRTNDEL